MSETNDQRGEEEAVKVSLAAHVPAATKPPPTVIKAMEEMFLRLVFNQAVVLKLMKDQGIDSP